MIPHTISKTLLASDPDQARAQLEELSGTLGAKDKAAGQRLRAVAVELVRRGLQVALVDYHNGWTELEATWPQAPHLGPVHPGPRRGRDNLPAGLGLLGRHHHR